MVTQDIKETQLIKVNPNNTGLLSVVDDYNTKKNGLNPLFTILNKDFNTTFKEDYDKQRPHEDKEGNLINKKWVSIINREYIETKQ